MLEDVKRKLGHALGELGALVRQKLDFVIEKNPGIKQLKAVSDVLNGKEAIIDMNPDMISALKFAPLQSCDVERTFSVYKSILAENRTSFTPENLEKYVICNCERRN